MIYPDSLPIVIEEKLNRLRHEGMLGQELHRAGIETNELKSLYGQISKPLAHLGGGALVRRTARLSQILLSFLRAM